ncbi:tetraspan protein Dni2 [Schizosaccharomyces octosporus yFS286]|uniref:Tetraspan protein Dni2 n=1 Tax=Schizosaccharomyces octosporus (strain yFS286) TaxID=483514 RepID=S9R7M0_SCHOY|nr:tetraspan protein Dni2 [Schizosaccharomyces octosporus yFS286]EPX74230.1 tetraspan protein Dni2 [Schizosaccharomyces octosporus yFS286]
MKQDQKVRPKFTWIGLVARVYNYIPNPNLISNIILGIAWLFLVFLCCGCLSKPATFSRILQIQSPKSTVDVGFFGVCSKPFNSTENTCHELRHWNPSNGMAYHAARFAWQQVHPVLLGMVVFVGTVSIVLTILKYVFPSNIRQWSICCLFTSASACLLLALQMGLANISVNSYSVGLNLTHQAVSKVGIPSAVFGWISSSFFFLFSVLHLGLWTIERNKLKLLEETAQTFNL